MDDLYREEILEHYRDPLNFGSLKKFDISSKQLNPFCGDEVEIFIKFKTQPQGLKTKVNKVSFTGKGCAISIAAASILTEYAKGKTKKRLTKLSEKDMLKLLKIEISETRKKCASLALNCLKECLLKDENKS